MMNQIQPALFVSHGTIFEALQSDYLRDGFRAIRQTQLPHQPDAIVVVSGHWLTRELTVTTAPRLFQMDEGFPPDFLVDYQPPGNPALANQITGMLANAGIASRSDVRRGLDHGALIPLRLLYPEADIPVVQLSLQYDLNPNFHRKVGEVLRPLRNKNVLFIGSGGLVHNREEIERFTGHAKKPDDWAAAFDAFVSHELDTPLTTGESLAGRLIGAYQHPAFGVAHPTAEHYLPIVVGGAMGDTAHKIFSGFQWKNLSMSAFRFD